MVTEKALNIAMLTGTECFIVWGYLESDFSLNWG